MTAGGERNSSPSSCRRDRGGRSYGERAQAHPAVMNTSEAVGRAGSWSEVGRKKGTPDHAFGVPNSYLLA